MVDKEWDEYNPSNSVELEESEERVKLSCKVCGVPVYVARSLSLSDTVEWELVCARCGVVPSIEVEGDVVTAVRKMEDNEGGR